jgi:hypothetical protein
MSAEAGRIVDRGFGAVRVVSSPPTTFHFHYESEHPVNDSCPAERRFRSLSAVASELVSGHAQIAARASTAERAIPGV